MTDKLTRQNQSIEKVFRIIEIMSQRAVPMQLQEIAQEADMPACTALRFVNTMVGLGYARQNADTLRYSLTAKFAYISELIMEQYDIRTIAHPHLEHIRAQCNESTCLAIDQDGSATYIDAVNAMFCGEVSVLHQVGACSPLHCTAVGKVLLLNYTEKQIDRIIDNRGLPALTPNTIVTKDALMEELEKIRARGYATNDEEGQLGCRCVAVPIYDYSGKVIASMGISAPCTRMTYKLLESVVPLLHESSKEVSQSHSSSM